MLSNILTKIIETIHELYKSGIASEFNTSKVKVEYSKFGNVDLSTNISFIIAPLLKKSSQDIASELSLILQDKIQFAQVVATNGYINFKLNDLGLTQILNGQIDALKKVNGFKNQNGEIMVEFGQPNTHKAFHIGHLKSAITGLSLSNLIENLGYKVIRTNYFGDVGLQVAKCIFGANIFLANIDYLKAIDSTGQISSLKLLDEGKLDEEIETENFDYYEVKIPEVSALSEEDVSLKDISSYQEVVVLIEQMDLKAKSKLVDKFYTFGAKAYKENQSLVSFIKSINKLVYDKTSDKVNFLYETTRKWSVEHQMDAFESLGIHYDRQYPESEVWKIGEKAVKDSVGKVFVIDEENGGSVILNKELLSESEKKQVKTFVYITRDGLPTYSAKDVGLVKLKLQEYPDLEKIIITTSIEQADYFKNLFKSLELLGLNPDQKLLQHIPFGWLLRNNKKQSSRMGDSIKGLDVLAEVIENVKSKMKFEDNDIATKIALASLKFLILSHEIHTDINYDPEEFTSLTGFSGVYVMYAYVRSLSILNSITDTKLVTQSPNTSQYSFSASESELVVKLSEFENVARVAGEKLQPHLVCHYLYDLATLFNKFYSENQVLVDDIDIKNVRLQIVSLTNQVLEKGMWLLGIEVVKRM